MKISPAGSLRVGVRALNFTHILPFIAMVAMLTQIEDDCGDYVETVESRVAKSLSHYEK